MQLVWLSTAIVFFHTFMHTFHTLGICFIPKWPVFIPGARFSYLFVIIKTIWYAIVWRSVPGRKGMKNVPKNKNLKVWNFFYKVWNFRIRVWKKFLRYENKNLKVTVWNWFLRVWKIFWQGMKLLYKGMKKVFKVWNFCIRVWKKFSFFWGYETIFEGMKKYLLGMKKIRFLQKNSFIP